jgi:ABC-2 type transport system ATP-binding protein
MQSAPKNLADRKFTDRPDSGQACVDPTLAICARGLSKHYRNPWTLKVTAGLQHLDLDLRCGEVLGYLGPNGAGKTTTLKLLAGLLKPTGGQAWLLGESIEQPRSRRRLGFLPEQPYFYDYLSGLEYLEMAGQLSGLGAQEAHRQAKHWLGRVGLGDRPTLRLRKYSKGMLQRMGLAAALVHGPELLILDEPMSGLDPFGRRDVRDLILEQKTRGVTVMFSSHILPDVELLCDRVAVVLRGRLSRVATVQEIVAGGSHRVEIVVQGLSVVEIPVAWRDRMKFEQRASDQLFVIESDAMLDETLAWLVRAGAHIKSVTPQRANLESLLVAASESEGGEGERRLA